MSYGCHNRAPFVAQRMAQDCQYTLSQLGQIDRGCDGCRWRHTPPNPLDILVWADGTMCYAGELEEEYRHMGDDYERVAVNSKQWVALSSFME